MIGKSPRIVKTIFYDPDTNRYFSTEDRKNPEKRRDLGDLEQVVSNLSGNIKENMVLEIKYGSPTPEGHKERIALNLGKYNSGAEENRIALALAA